MPNDLLAQASPDVGHHDVHTTYTCPLCGAASTVTVTRLTFEPLSANDVERSSAIAMSRWALARRLEERGGPAAGPPPDAEQELIAEHRAAMLAAGAASELQYATCPVCNARNPHGGRRPLDAEGVGLFVVACVFAGVLVASAAAFIAYWPPLVFLFLVPQTLGVMAGLLGRGVRSVWPAVALWLAGGLAAYVGAGWLVPALQLAGSAVELAIRHYAPSPRWEEAAARLRFDVRPSDAG